MSQNQTTINTYKKLLGESIQEGTIDLYSESDIILDTTQISYSAHETVYQATEKRSGMAIVVVVGKTLFPNGCSLKEGLHTQFIKEVCYELLTLLS